MDSKKHSSIGDYLLAKTLGEGSGTKCKLGVHKTSGKEVAIKIMKRSSPEVTASFLKLWKNEVHIMKSLTHPNIVQLYEADEDGVKLKKSGEEEPVLYLTLELIKGGELFDFVASTGQFSEPVARFYFKQLISGLEYLNNKGLAHRDLKPENLMLDENFNLKIGDFGFATWLEGKHGDGFNKTSLGTKGYMAPEIHMKKAYNGTSADLFASAVILFIMVARHPPFTRAELHDPFYKPLVDNNHEVFWHLHTKSKPGKDAFFSQEFKHLISAMLAFQPEQRLSLADVKAHPWMEGATATYEEVQAEFAKRFQMIETERKLKAQKKAAIKAMKAGGAYSGYKATRRSAATEDDDGKEAEEEGAELASYIGVGNLGKLNTVFSKESPEVLMEFFGIFAGQNCSSFDMAKNKPKLSMRFLAENEEEVVLKARVTRAEDELYAVEFSRVRGSNGNYVERMEQLIEAMGDMAMA